MSAPLPISAVRLAAACDQFVISHGKGGAVGIFTTPEPLALRRGQCVIVQTVRGVEIGTVLCPASDRKAALLGANAAGQLLRCLTDDDAVGRSDLAALERDIFEASRTMTQRDGLAIEILDVELLFDCSVAMIQFVGEAADTETFAQSLEQQFGLMIRLENLTVKHAHDDEHQGCDKPDCGRQAGGEGGCTTCSTGGGCSTCGSSKVDLREYFGHLRTKMEEKHRIPLA